MSRLNSLTFSLGFCLLLSACRSDIETTVELPTATLYAYRAPTPSATVPQQTREPEEVTLVLPTATPFFHTVVADDTLLGIAIRYGLELDELLNANPGINPRILSIGQKIQIPNPQGTPGALLPTATPIPLTFSDVHCYATLNRASWCLFTVENADSSRVEGISAQLSIFTPDGDLIQQLIVAAPHNLLLPNSGMPMGAYFTEEIGNDTHSTVTLLSAFAAPESTDRYVSLDVSWVSEPISSSTWRVGGEVSSDESNHRSSTAISVLVSAFGDGDNLIGFIKNVFTANLEPGGRFAFSLDVYSLGPSIENVEVMVEDVSGEGSE